MDKYIQAFCLFFMMFFYGFIIYFAMIDGMTIDENIILLTMAGVIAVSMFSNNTFN